MKMTFAHVRISGRLLLPPLVTIAFFLIPAAAVYVSVHQQNVSLEAVKGGIAARSGLASVANELSNVHAAVSRALVAKRGGTNELAALVREKSTILDRNSVVLQDLAKSEAHDGAERKLYETALQKLRTYRISIENAAGGATNDRLGANTLVKDADEQFQSLRAALYELERRQDGSLADAVSLCQAPSFSETR
jgi:hypothetical protein